MSTNNDLLGQCMAYWETWAKLWTAWGKGLTQTINFPSGDVPMDFLNWKPQIEIEYHGDPTTERRIYKDHAGVGSQLGTIIDAVADLADGASGSEAIEKLKGLKKDVDAEKARTMEARLEEMADFLKKNEKTFAANPETLAGLVAAVQAIAPKADAPTS